MANRRTGTNLAPSGRNSLLTQATQGVICASVRSGNWLETAAQMAGIDRDTLFAWKRKGKSDLEAGLTNSIYAQFVNAIARAEADAEAVSVARVRTAAQKDWRAAAWYLERRHSDRWTLNQSVTAEEAHRDRRLTTEFILSPEAPLIVDALFDAYEAQVKAKLPSDQEDAPY